MHHFILSSLALVALSAAAVAETPSHEAYDGADELLGGRTIASDTANTLLETNVPIHMETAQTSAPTPDIVSALRGANFIDEPQDAPRPAPQALPRTQNDRPLLNWDGRAF